MDNLTWKCHICGDTRPDDKISVCTTDTSKKYNLPEGTMQQNVRYCNDRQDCIDKAKTYSFDETKEKKKIPDVPKEDLAQTEIGIPMSNWMPYVIAIALFILALFYVFQNVLTKL